MLHENPYGAPRASLDVELKPLQFDGFNNVRRYVASFFCAVSVLLGLYSLWVESVPVYRQVTGYNFTICFLILSNVLNIVFLLRFAHFGKRTILTILCNSIWLLCLGGLLLQMVPFFVSFRTGIYLAFFVLIPCGLTLCIAIMSRNAYKKLAL
jgi:hypothetical protein